MATIEGGFTATTEWQELTGVSEVSGKFLIENRSSTHECLLFTGGATAPTEDAATPTLFPNYERLVDGTTTAETFWIRVNSNISTNTVIISITEEV